jgi:hypothetical protein
MTEAEQILKQIRDYRPPRELQPISQLALRLYLENGKKLEKPQLDQLRAELDAIEDLVKLADAMCGLFVFSNYVVGQLKDEAVGPLINELVASVTYRYDDAYALAATALDDTAKQATDSLGRFQGESDDELTRRAPQFGVAPPAGAFPVASLNPAPLRPMRAKPKAKPPAAARR